MPTKRLAAQLGLDPKAVGRYLWAPRGCRRACREGIDDGVEHLEKTQPLDFGSPSRCAVRAGSTVVGCTGARATVDSLLKRVTLRLRPVFCYCSLSTVDGSIRAIRQMG